MHKRSIMQKTIQVGGSTVLSRFLGIAREILLTKYLGASALLDAFITAFKIPNSLRKIFAEGALSASCVPTIVTMVKAGDKKHIDSFMTRSLIVIEGILIAACILIFWQAPAVMRLIVPGWFVTDQTFSFLGIPIPAAWLGYGEPILQVTHAIVYLRILIAFIVFISSSALLAAALQAVNHFFVPAFSPVLLNIFFIAGVLIGWIFNLSPVALCVFILIGGLAQFLAHLYMYWRYNFGFSMVHDPQAERYFNHALKKFFPCLLSMSAMELTLFVDTSFASYLPEGSVSLIYLGNRFMGIALGVFAVAFSTILLPHFSRISTYAPKRLSFYLLEATKLIFWVTMPVVIMMCYFADEIYTTLFLSPKFTLEQAHEAGFILIAFLIGLFFFSVNKILLNIFYALHNTRTPAWIAFAGTLLNIALNALFIDYLQGFGLALATTLSGVVQTLLFVLFLRIHFDLKMYGKIWFLFALRYMFQLTCIFTVFLLIYQLCLAFLTSILPLPVLSILVHGIGFWLWVGPLCMLAFLTIFFTRRMFNVNLYFLE